ncbi:hypothetical protein L1987_84675 [Smallanthus sonchifolius]|uniref:Uncharacterized protein n=1 Tax=Smallanthus sonchifolius TaxID=185202 RepID=A0ACB8XUL0_9ASTR|nr:hypothetical protein L1987_84675 [Smallanthus sonchifolius]
MARLIDLGGDGGGELLEFEGSHIVFMLSDKKPDQDGQSSKKEGGGGGEVSGTNVGVSRGGWGCCGDCDGGGGDGGGCGGGCGGCGGCGG